MNPSPYSTILSSLGIMAMSIIFNKVFASNGRMQIPGEWKEHSHTCMVWPATPEIWNDKKETVFDNLRDDIARIAVAISAFEPVVLIVDPDQLSSVNDTFNSSQLQRISLLPFPVNDLWARDTLPVFGIQSKNDTNSSELVGIDLNFNGWGKKQEHDKDSQLASKYLTHFNTFRIQSSFIAEGGSLEFDGEGTLLVTESSVLNPNRNSGLSKESLESELKSLFGIEKVIWFPGVVGKDITDAHVDSLVRFASPGVVLLNRPPKYLFNGTEEENEDVWAKSSNKAKEILESETDAKGRKFKILQLLEPNPEAMDMEGVEGRENDFLSSYVNFLVVNGGVIMPQFGDKEADDEAKKVMASAFPERKVVGVSIKYLASGGGGIHCATRDVPMAENAAGRNGLFV